MKIVGSCHICRTVFIACRQLLKHVHVPQLYIIGGRRIESKTNKEPVLVKIVICDLLSEIHMYLII
jgi:hypothetical protein